MKPTVIASTLLLGSLFGCATQTAEPRVATARVPVSVAPPPAVTPDMPVSEASYVAARMAHGQGQLGRAVELYARVLETDARHLGALNGLGVIKAQEGSTDEALALFARARSVNPAAAHVHNNLGYTLLQAERLDEAGVALKRAMELDPGNLHTLHNIKLLAEAQRRVQAVAASRVPAQPLVSASGENAGELVAVAPQIYELRPRTPQAIEAAARVGAVPNPAAVASAPVESVSAMEPPTTAAQAMATANTLGLDLRRLRLEVANGVGVQRLARRTADILAHSGMRAVRLTNEWPYRQVRTQIRYVAGQEVALNALVQRLPVSVELVSVPSLPARMQLKLVLGRDFSGQAIAAWINGQGAERVTARPQAQEPLS